MLASVIHSIARGRRTWGITLALLALFVVGGFGAAAAATRVWNGSGVTGGTGSTDFNNGNNWTPTGALLSTDDYVIRPTANGSAILTADITVKSLVDSAVVGSVTHTLSTANFTLTVTNNLNARDNNGSTTILVFNVGNAIGSAGSLVVGGTANFGNGDGTSTSRRIRLEGFNRSTSSYVFRGPVFFGEISRATTATNYPGKYVFDATGNQSVLMNSADGMAFSVVEIGGTNAPTVTLDSTSTGTATLNAAALNAAGTTNANLTVLAGSTLRLCSETLNRSASGGTLTLGAGAVLRVSGTSNFPTNFSTMTLDPASTVVYDAASGTSQTIANGPTYGNLTLDRISGASTTTKTAGGTLTIAGNLTIKANAVFAAGTSLTHNIGGNWVNNGAFSFTTASTINFNTAGQKTISGSATTGFNNITINKGADTTSVVEATGPMTMSGNLTLTNGMLKLTHASAVAQFNAAPTIAATAGLWVNGGTLNGGNFGYTLNGLMRVSAGTATIGTATGNALTIGSGARLQVTGTGTVDVAGRVLNNGSYDQFGGTLNTNSVALSSSTNAAFESPAASNITMTGGVLSFEHGNSSTGGDLKIAAGGTKSFTGGTIQVGNSATPASQIIKLNSTVPVSNLAVNATNAPTGRIDTNALTVLGNVTVNGGGLDAGTNNLGLDVGGNWTMASGGGFIGGSSAAVAFNGGSAQTINGPGATTFSNLTLNNAAGLSLNVTGVAVNGTLLFTSGKITTGTNILVLGQTAGVSGAGAGKYVFGNLQRAIGTGTSLVRPFDVGDATKYTPISLTFASVTSGPITLTAATTSTPPGAPAPGSLIAASKYVNRNWTLSTVLAGTFTTCTAAMTFDPADVVGGADPNSFIVAKFNSPVWTNPTVGTRTATSTQATGITSIAAAGATALMWVGEPSTYTITATAGPNGTITPSGAVTVNNGDSQSFTMTPDPGYEIADVLVDGGSVGPVASYTFSNVVANHTIAVSFQLSGFAITASAGPNGAITPSGIVNVVPNADQTFTIAPNACYHIVDVLVDGGSMGPVSSYTFTNVTAPHTIAASFDVDVETITASAGPNGSISPSGAVAVNCGTNSTFTITPDPCYHVADVLVDGGSAGAVASYTFTNVTGNHTIAASFAITVETITASAGPGGSITPSGAVAVNCGDSQTFAIGVTDPCYQLADVLVDNVSAGAVTSYTFTNVTAAHTIAASFSILTYGITATAGPDGSITPGGTVTLNCGSSQTYTIAPNTCFNVLDVVVDGGSVGAVTSYAFTSVTANHTISASFTPVLYSVATSSGPGGIIAPVGGTTLPGLSEEFTGSSLPAGWSSYAWPDGNGSGTATVGGGVLSVNGARANPEPFTSTATRSMEFMATFAGEAFQAAGLGAGNHGNPNTVFDVDPFAVFSTGSTGTELITRVFTGVTPIDFPVPGSWLGAPHRYGIQWNPTSIDFSIDGTLVHSETATIAGPMRPAFSDFFDSGVPLTVDWARVNPYPVGCGGAQAFAITPDPCYQVTDVQVDGGSVGAVSGYTFASVQASHTLAATFALVPYTVTATAGDGGTITPSGGVTVNCGTSQSFSIAADGCHTLADVVVDGGSVGAVASYAFTNVQANHTIAASFTLNTYTLTASAGAGGTVSPSGAVLVDCGADQTIAVAADACHHTVDVLVDGVSVGAVASYAFTNVTASHTLAASFAIDVETLTASATAGGSITPSGATPVDCGSDQSFAIAADPCHHLVDVLVDGGSVGAVTSYAFTNVTASHTIAASFAIDIETITASAGPNGSITPSGATAVNCGSDQSFSIAPAACYGVANVLVDGGSVGAVASYTFLNVTANHTISVTFALSQQTITASAGAGGSISPSGTVTLDCGSNQTFAISANACQHIVDVLVDGGSVGPVASYTFTNVTANHVIAASFAIDIETITATATAGGSITPSGAASVNCGSDQTFTIAASPCYHLDGLEVDGAFITPVTSYTFLNVTADHTIDATFVIDTYTVWSTAGTGGSIGPLGGTTVNCGTSQTYTITPDACYGVLDVVVDGSSVGPVTSYTFTNIQAGHTIDATFLAATYTVAASAGIGGTISPSGPVSVSCHAGQSFTISPDACHTIGDVLVDGVSVGATASYGFTDVQANHTIAASFTVIVETITATAGPNGSISPSGAVSVDCGTNESFAIAADPCYHIADVLVDGGSVGAVASYTFTNVTGNHTISASFAVTVETIAASAGAGGSISPSGAVTLDCGSSQTFAISANACQHIADVLVDGGSVGSVASYTFTNVTTSHTISASFAVDVETITVTAGLGGSITPSGAVSVNCGSDQTFAIAGDACHTIADVLVDGGSVGAVASYTFTSVTANHTISASFTLVLYSVATSSGPGGIIAPVGGTTLPGLSEEFTGSSLPAGWSSYAWPDGNGSGTATVGGGVLSVNGARANPEPFASTATRSMEFMATFAGEAFQAAGLGAGNHGNPNTVFDVDPFAVFSTGATGTELITRVFTGVTPIDFTVPGSWLGVPHRYGIQWNPTSIDFSIDGTLVHSETATIAGPMRPAFSDFFDSGVPLTVDWARVNPYPVGCGGAQAFAITPDPCYQVTDVQVDGGSVGVATSYTFGNVTANHTLTATFAITPYMIAATAGAGGSITPSGTTPVSCGASQSFSIAADGCHTLADVLVDGGTVGAVTSYTFANVQANHTIAASFTLNTYTLTASAGAGGTIAPDGAVSVNCGDGRTFAIAPDACHSIGDVLVDGASVGAVASYAFSNVTASYTIAASFTLNTYTLTASAGPNGSITPSGPVAVNCGGAQAFAIAANPCYLIGDVLVDGASVGAVASYSFANVAANHTIAASFTLVSYTITATAAAGGGITPGGAVAVGCGASQSFTIAPDGCHAISDVVVDGVSAGAVASYTFTGVTANHTIAASFALNSYTITATPGAGGSITPSGIQVVTCGGSQTFAIAGNPCYGIADVVVDGASVGAVASYTFANVTANHTITASFTAGSYTIAASAGTGGSISPSGSVVVTCAGNQTFTIAPAACYSNAGVLVDGAAVGAVSSYTFINVTANHTIAASFTLDTYTITASAGANGTITPSGAVVVSCGGGQSFAIAAAAGYHILDVLVDAGSVGAVASYAFANVHANHTIAASFQIDAGSPVTKILSFRADRANGSAPYPVPGSSGPWYDLTGRGNNADLTGYNNTLVSGWAGDGSAGAAYRLEMTGSSQFAAVTKLVPELQTVGPVTAEVWFKTSFEAPVSGQVSSLLDWLQADDRGMSIGYGNGQLLIGLADWVQVAPVQPDQWYQVIVAKDASGQRVYLNGALAYTNADAYNGKQETPIAIGANVYGFISGMGTFKGFMRGAIGQVEIWTGAMSDARALAEFTADQAQYLPTLPLPTPTRVTSFEAARANGSGPYTNPGAGSPWVDLLSPASNATLLNFDGTATSGWQGLGTPASPYRLKFDGTNDVCVVAPQAVSELHNVHAYSAELWFQTPASVSGATQHYLLEWLAGTASQHGMSIAVFNSQLQIKTVVNSGWQACAAVSANTWYHLVVSKQPGETRVYLNGVRRYTGGAVWFSEPYMNVTVGASTFRGNGSFGEYWNGAIGQVHFWKGAVTDDVDHAVYVASAPTYQQMLAVDEATWSELSLAGVRPNPVTGPVNVVFTLASARPALLELIDLTGRVVRSQQVGAMGAGRHMVTLGHGRELPAGIYWLKLNQGERTLSAKATIVH